MIKDGLIRHDPSLVASSIIELICDDLKYQDKQSDPQYLMLMIVQSLLVMIRILT